MRAFQGRAAASRLQEKGVFRKSSEMIGMTPVGNLSAGRIENVSAFEGAGEDGVEAWYDHVAEATVDFCDGERITSTAREHASYFANISEWCVSMGLPALCERAGDDDRVRFLSIKPKYRESGEPVVMRPEALLSMLSMMSVGDARAPKNLRLMLKRKASEALLASGSTLKLMPRKSTKRDEKACPGRPQRAAQRVSRARSSDPGVHSRRSIPRAA